VACAGSLDGSCGARHGETCTGCEEHAGEENARTSHGVSFRVK
jgi:hypothetical protein